ncbi:MAG: hypothetical protein GY869_08840, partial [Planctomycetes bacterium]|nr:hypothetical protein [Planctomycetota bacterium]
MSRIYIILLGMICVFGLMLNGCSDEPTEPVVAEPGESVTQAPDVSRPEALAPVTDVSRDVEPQVAVP